MSRSLDFTACIKQDSCPVKDCWRKLTKEERDCAIALQQIKELEK